MQGSLQGKGKPRGRGRARPARCDPPNTVYGYFVIRDTALIHVKITTIYVYTGTTTFGNLVFGNFAVIQYQGTQGHYTSSYIILCMGNLADHFLTVGDNQLRSFRNLNGINFCCTGDCFSI